MIAITSPVLAHASATDNNTTATQQPQKFYDAYTNQWYISRADDGLYPITRVRKLVSSDVQYMSNYELRLMRNEIYARHGYIFSSDDLREYFGRQSWYYPISKNVSLNAIETYNVNFIKQIEDNGHRAASVNNDGLYPATRLRKLTYNDICHLSKAQLRIMRNEIYARHGYIFASEDLRRYFGAQPWYRPVTKNVTLSATEQYNVNFIKQYE